MRNDFDVRGDITVIFLRRRDGTVLQTIIDTADLPKAMEIPGRWHAAWSEDMNDFYVLADAYKTDGKKTTMKMHRYLTGAPRDLVVDHINHKTLDNRRSNLRIITHADNQQNRRGPYRTSKSGVRGVSWEKNCAKWRARSKLNGTSVCLGLYESIAEAEAAVVTWRARNMPYSMEGTALRKAEAGL